MHEKSGKMKLSNLGLRNQQCWLTGSLPAKFLHFKDLLSHLRQGKTLAKTMTVVWWLSSTKLEVSKST